MDLCSCSCSTSGAYCIKAECFLTLCLATLQVSQVKADADKQVAHLTSSLKQAQSQAAGISQERERLAAQVQQQAATPQAVPEVSPCASSKQEPVTLQISLQGTNRPYQSMRLLRSRPACGHASLFKQEQLVILPYLPLHALFARCLHDATQPSTVIAYNPY